MAQLTSTTVAGNLAVTGDIVTSKIILPSNSTIDVGEFDNSISVESNGDIHFAQEDTSQFIYFHTDELFIDGTIYSDYSRVYFGTKAQFEDGFESGTDCKISGTLEATSFNASSDARLKENFEDYSPQASILELPIYKYDFIDGQKAQIGCKAQDLQKICPEIVQEGENGYLSIQESKIVYLLIDEIKKLKEEIKQLKEK